jgi:hypothetical protein
MYLSVMGEGDPPENHATFLGSGYDWRVENWVFLPTVPLFDSDRPAVVELSFIPSISPNGARSMKTIEVFRDRVEIVE